MLEMMTPSTDHERVNRRLHSLVETILRAWKLKADNVGSNTFKRKDLEKGFEPDTCFYIQNVASVLGKERIDLRSDPPPDLVIEVEVTNAVINKLALYAAVGVPEVWRWDGSSVHFLVLQKGEYAVSTESRVIQGLRSDIVSQFIRDSRTQELTEWLDAVERWARHNRRG
jgi:Uma2 family endonuclease